jgi:hypothetical protein
MKLVFTQPTAASCRAVNDLLNSPTIEDLVEECEALLYEIECRIRNSDRDKARLAAVRRRVFSIVPFVKPARRHVRAKASVTRLSSKGD